MQVVAKKHSRHGSHERGKSLQVGFHGSEGNSGSVSYHTPTPKLSVTDRLKSLGLAGLVAYGVFNTLYYSIAFTFIWHYVAKVPSGRGLSAAATSALKVLGLTWVGSQATKGIRAAGALLLAPAIDRMLGVVKHAANLPSKRQAFLLIVLPSCVGFALVLFGSTVLFWA